MRIFVKLFGTRALPLEVEGSTTVEELKARIQGDYTPDQLRLYYGNKQLEEASTLSHYYIPADSTLHVVLLVSGQGGHAATVTCGPSSNTLFPTIKTFQFLAMGTIKYQIITVRDMIGDVPFEHRGGNQLFLGRPSISPRCVGNSDEDLGDSMNVCITVRHEPIRMKVHLDNVSAEPVETELPTLPTYDDVLPRIRTMFAEKLNVSPFKCFTLHNVRTQSTQLREVCVNSDLVHPEATNVFVVKPCD